MAVKQKAGEHKALSRKDMTVFAVKSGLLKVRRAARDLCDARIRRLPRGPAGGAVVAEVVTPLYTEADPNEMALQLGKVQNLRVAARALDGVVIRRNEVFSFWAHVGRPTRARGYVEGRELRQGCLIPTVAGGLCQMSNSLYRAATQAGCEIVERHGHTAAVPGSPFPPGEDATVFWNYVDLRFRSPCDLRLGVTLGRGDLSVRLEVPA